MREDQLLPGRRDELGQQRWRGSPGRPDVLSCVLSPRPPELVELPQLLPAVAVELKQNARSWSPWRLLSMEKKLGLMESYAVL